MPNPLKTIWRVAGGGILGGTVLGFGDLHHHAGQMFWDVVAFLSPAFASQADPESWKYVVGGLAASIIVGVISGVKSLATTNGK